MMGQFRFHPDDYGALLRSGLPAYEPLQGLDAAVVWAERDLAVIVAVKPSASAAAG